FSGKGELLQKIRSPKVTLKAPHGIAVNDDGTVWVADGGNYNVKLLKPDGELLTIFDGGPKWPLTMAKGLAVDKQGRVYVADTLSNLVRVFDKNGNDLFSIGPVNDKPSVFRLPVGLSIDRSGRIYVADQGNNKIQVWGWR
ncbi:MAG: NHL repeat-containing protein, partial [Eubacteriales bacterium]